MLRRSILMVSVTTYVFLGAVPPAAHADQRPMPPSACPGGKMTMYGSPTGHGWCDGEHFADGSFWRASDFELPDPPPLVCLIDDNPWVTGPAGIRTLAPAPHGGCGGAV